MQLIFVSHSYSTILWNIRSYSSHQALPHSHWREDFGIFPTPRNVKCLRWYANYSGLITTHFMHVLKCHPVSPKMYNYNVKYKNILKRKRLTLRSLSGKALNVQPLFKAESFCQVILTLATKTGLCCKQVDKYCRAMIVKCQSLGFIVRACS